jgi:hypothetical protein
MIKPLFIGDNTIANTNQFAKIPFPESKGFSITVDSGDVVGGTPTYTLCVCNFNGDESDFIDIADATNLPLTDAVKSSSFEFAYLGVKFTSNSATGTMQIYLNVLN